MSDPHRAAESHGDTPDEDLEAVYGPPAEGGVSSLAQVHARRREYRPWHHPVKQIVRNRQWAGLTRELISTLPAGTNVLRYFTLPGPDLLDVRVLADACEDAGVRIEYFGFDTDAPDATEVDRTGEQHRGAVGTAGWNSAEAALRQAGRITDRAVILPDRLEDIAVQRSQAREQLRHREPFHVINIDACDHLAFLPRGRAHSVFDALRVLLGHQMHARWPWLLFVTTRVSPALLEGPGAEFQNAIAENLNLGHAEFSEGLAAAIGTDPPALAAALATAWARHDLHFLRLYSVGLGKYLLQFYNGNLNNPADVRLRSSYAYRVSADQPDMLALAFSITPDEPRVLPPAASGSVMIPPLEPARAARVVRRTMKLWDLDSALESDPVVRDEAVTGTIKLLETANYDIAGWRAWLASHSRRPMTLDGATGV